MCDYFLTYLSLGLELVWGNRWVQVQLPRSVIAHAMVTVSSIIFAFIFGNFENNLLYQGNFEPVFFWF